MKTKMDYEKKALDCMARMNHMHEFPNAYNEKLYRSNAVLCNMYMILMNKESMNTKMQSK